VYATAFHAHPYAIPTIGHESDIKAWTQADLEHYFQTYYTPNNALMVIVGDVDAEKVRTLAEQRFASLPARALPPRVRTIEPEQKGERRVFVRKASAHTANIMVSYKAPPARHADYYPLLLLEALLTEGKASRLHKALVDTRLASEVGSDFSHSLDPGLFNLFAVAASKVSAATLERALLAELDTLVRTGVSEAELNRARQQKRMQYYRQLETINGKASLLGDYQVFFGDYRLAFEVPAALDRVTPEEVRQVAERYMRPSARTVGVLAAQEE
jgi:predicted Zn-dependent peptidase